MENTGQMVGPIRNPMFKISFGVGGSFNNNNGTSYRYISLFLFRKLFYFTFNKKSWGNGDTGIRTL